MKRIHIIGTGPRTGTTLMAEAMIACFDIDHYTKHEDRIFEESPARGNIFLTKAPQDIMVVKWLLIVNPDLYVICMIRDPRDAVVSRHKREPDKYWASLRYWKTYIPYWRRMHRHPRCITVKYEDLVSDPDHVQEILMEKMPFLNKKTSFSQYHTAANPSQDSLDALDGVRPILPNGVGNWRKHLKRIARQVQLHGSITKDLIEFGYEKDDSWMNVLEGIEPDISEGYWREYFTKEDLRKRTQGKYKEVLKTILRRCGINPTRLKKNIKKLMRI